MPLPNGDVTLCDMDWSLRHIIGNLSSQDYASIFTSPEFSDIVERLAQPSSDLLCRLCSFAKGVK